MAEFDLFVFFRTTLFMFLAIYTLLAGAGTIWRVTRALRGDDPRNRLLRLYLSYQLASVRLRPLSGELLMIAVWALALCSIWWLHTRIG
ncbi:MAG: hypothetical protein KKB50_01025 [Planctomycetes bacterium]|nr:hypothetical protein [Planctomycetota bacterium]